jgi:hypothetical protein
MAKRLVLKTDHSIEMVGTLEIIHGISGIADVTLNANGAFELEWDTNGTKIDWNSQSTVHEDGRRVFVDRDGNEYLENQLELIKDTEEENDIDDGGPYNEPGQ